ncbi:unnamed protein product [Cladocopium goreaui]|uniref:Tyr recombinase domain-containing protein n=1 Tax=Cladocopium goreaui TaxID=2562237 RepID=A0A9P1D4F9_9DINO|nr:unnamed protein product [Cladocopium goreaui]
MNTPWDACKRLRTNKIDLHGPLPPVPVTAKVCHSECVATEILSFKQIGVKAAKHADDRLWSDKLSWERKCAYKKWVSIILRQVGAFDIARQQATCHTMEFARGGLLESVKDSLGTKASSTLHARAGPILQYIQFCEDRGLQAFPLIEPVVYDYVKSCETKAATYARSFLLALSFTNFHFGLTGTLSIMSSGRIRGLANTMYSKKRKLTQRPPLSVDQIEHLENIVLDGRRTEFDRLAGGFFLFILMGRLRFSDGQQVCQLKLDQQPDGFGFVEAVAAKTKTSVSLERKTRHLPVAVPLMAFGARQWLPTWLELRKKAFGDASNSKEEFIPLLPSPTANGSWTKIPLTVTEPGYEVAEEEELSESFPKEKTWLAKRKMSASYDVLEPKPSFCHPACQLCFKDRATCLLQQTAERAERLRLQQQRLSGVNISGSKKDQTLTFDSTGVLKLHKQSRVEPCSTATEIQVRYCLTRRALALEQANVVSFKNMESWSEKMMQSRLDEPPPSYIKTTMKQLEPADRKLFLLISEKTREGIKCNAKGRPVDDVFKECMESSEVMSLLQPRPGGSSAGPRPAEAHPEGDQQIDIEMEATRQNSSFCEHVEEPATDPLQSQNCEQRRIAILTDWARRAKALSNLETQLKSNMNPNVAKIMAPKRILLMRTMDHTLWSLFTVLKFLLFDGRLDFTLSSGEHLCAEVHPAWKSVEPNFKTSCIDLKSAYKQLPLNEDNYKDSVVTIWNPDKKCVECFVMKVLPFGAAASVHHFLRVSTFLQAVGRYMGLLWSAFFDDFVLLSHAMHESSTMTTALSLFDILGFQYSKDKLQPFKDKTEMLGVELDLSAVKTGTIKVRNKASRTSELCEILERILKQKKVVVKELPTTLGKLQFAKDSFGEDRDVLPCLSSDAMKNLETK